MISNNSKNATKKSNIFIFFLKKIFNPKDPLCLMASHDNTLDIQEILGIKIAYNAIIMKIKIVCNTVTGQNIVVMLSQSNTTMDHGMLGEKSRLYNGIHHIKELKNDR